MDHPEHASKCSLMMAAVLIFTSVLTSPGTCRTPNKAISTTIRLMRAEIQTSLGNLPADGLLPGASCSSLNGTGLVGGEEQPPSGRILPLFRCHMGEMSNVTKELEPGLLAISQLSQDVEERMAGSGSRSSCSLPDFQQDRDKYQFVRCLLELLDQVLSHIKP